MRTTMMATFCPLVSPPRPLVGSCVPVLVPLVQPLEVVSGVTNTNRPDSVVTCSVLAIQGPLTVTEEKLPVRLLRIGLD